MSLSMGTMLKELTFKFVLDIIISTSGTIIKKSQSKWAFGGPEQALLGHVPDRGEGGDGVQNQVAYVLPLTLRVTPKKELGDYLLWLLSYKVTHRHTDTQTHITAL